MADNVKAVVLVDLYRWQDGDAVSEAGKGEEISVSSDEYKRGDEADALAKPGSDAAKAAKKAASGAPAEPAPAGADATAPTVEPDAKA